MEVHPRRELRVEAMDNSLSDINYFRHEDVDDRTVSIKVAKSLEDLVDRVSAEFIKRCISLVFIKPSRWRQVP